MTEDDCIQDTRNNAEIIYCSGVYSESQGTARIKRRRPEKARAAEEAGEARTELDRAARMMRGDCPWGLSWFSLDSGVSLNPVTWTSLLRYSMNNEVQTMLVFFF